MSSSRHTFLLVGALVFALIASNAFWLFTVLDQGMAQADRNGACEMECRALDEALNVMVRFGDRQDARAVLRAHSKTLPSEATFEKEGAVWVDSLGFAFSKDGRLREAKRAWSPSACE